MRRTSPQPEQAARPHVLLGLIRATLLWRKAIRQQHKADAPADAVILNKRASRIVRQAEESARLGRMDMASVLELRQLAGHRRYALGDALKNFKRENLHLDSRQYNRAVRLLDSAMTKAPIAPEDPGITDRLNALERLRGLGDVQAFDELARLEPDLVPVRDEIALLPVRRWPQSLEELRDYSETRLRIYEKLRPLLGRERAGEHPILSSVTAQSVAVGYLGRIVCPEGPPRRERPPAS
jgi:hypothetical protein